jgi:3-dehydroquinate synthase II
MKQAWVRLEKWSDELAVAAIESGADALILPEGFTDRAKALGRITVVSPDGDLKPGSDIYFEPLGCAADETRIRERLIAGKTTVIASAGESRQSSSRPHINPVPWEVIPLENLLAVGSGSIFVPASSAGEIELALGVLEKGVTGVVISSEDVLEIKSLVSAVKKMPGHEPLRIARIENISRAGIGDRVCVDTCTFMNRGEGMLVGNSSGFLFLVQAETEKSPYVAPRPFRVNAGPVHSYARIPEGRTCYLSELRAGRRILVYGPDGTAAEATVGRVKIERRPLLLIEAISEGERGSILLQNAETIRLTAPDGEPVSVSQLEPGDSILVAVEASGRHFGMKVDETIRED